MKGILLFLIGLIVGMAACYGAMAVGWIKLRWWKEAEEFFERVDRRMEEVAESLEKRAREFEEHLKRRA